MFNKKIESSTFDVFALYVCMGLVTYVVGKIAYGVGKEKGMEEQRKRHNGIPTYYDFYGKES